jgi:hypothetical protein
MCISVLGPFMAYGAYNYLKREVRSATAEKSVLPFDNNPRFHSLHIVNVNFKNYLLWSVPPEFLATAPGFPGSISGATRFSEK